MFSSACSSITPIIRRFAEHGGFRTRAAAELAAPSLKRPGSETLHKTGNALIEQKISA
jgi:hypothetical protein